MESRSEYNNCLSSKAFKCMLTHFTQSICLKSYKTELTQLGLEHTYPDVFESATFSFLIQLPSTCIRCFRIRIRSPEWTFLNTL